LTPTFASRVEGDDLLARFVMVREWIRIDGTVRPDAFIPPKDLNLSTTRHGTLSATALWELGESVARQFEKDLIGRADVAAKHVRSVGLGVETAPLPENLHHAHVTGWPADKPSQKILAQQIAASSAYVKKP
jgi:hypothetical protein